MYKYTRKSKVFEGCKESGRLLFVYGDFYAPRLCEWDTSAAMIACSGMLLICQLENGLAYIQPVAEILRVYGNIAD